MYDFYKENYNPGMRLAIFRLRLTRREASNIVNALFSLRLARAGRFAWDFDGSN